MEAAVSHRFPERGLCARLIGATHTLCPLPPSAFRFILNETCSFREGHGVGQGEFRIKAAYRDALAAQQPPAEAAQHPSPQRVAQRSQAAARPRFGPASRKFHGR